MVIERWIVIKNVYSQGAIINRWYCGGCGKVCTVSLKFYELPKGCPNDKTEETSQGNATEIVRCPSS